MPPNPYGTADLITLKKPLVEKFGVCTVEILENWTMLAAMRVLPLHPSYKNSNNKNGMVFVCLPHYHSELQLCFL